MGCQAAALSILRTVKKINYKIWNPVWSPNCYDITRKKLVEEYTVPRNLVIRKGSFRASRPRLKCDGTRAETRFRLSAKRTSLFKSAGGGASVQSTTGSSGVRISGSNAGYTMFRGSVKSTGYPLHLNRPVGVSSVDY